MVSLDCPYIFIQIVNLMSPTKLIVNAVNLFACSLMEIANKSLSIFSNYYKYYSLA